MRQILIINSLSDERFKVFFEKVFFTVGVGTLWKNYEDIESGKPARELFQKEIAASDALFLILNGEVQTLSKTQDWLFKEPGFAGGKDVWVFGHCEDLKRISVPVPALKHYVAFYITNAWNDYVVKIAEAFEAGKAAPAPLAGVRPEVPSTDTIGSLFDGSTGMALYDYSSSRPMGVTTACPHCAAFYDIHLPSDMKVFRCPACGSFCGIKSSVKTPVPATG